MDISLRARQMPSSPIRKLAPYAEKAAREGVRIYHLNIGQPDIRTPQVALDSLRSIDRTILEYSPSDGFRSLREKMSRYYDGYGIALAPDEIIITAGGSEAVLFAFLTCLGPGDEIIVTDPFYANYMAFAISVGAVVKGVKTRIEDGFCLPGIEEVEACITPRTKAILICNPNNPTGYLYTREELERLRDIVVGKGLFLIVDEVYREFVYSGHPYVSAFHIEGMEQNLIMVDSVSKRYSECGTRIGCLCTHNTEVHDAVMKFCQARLSPPLVGQIVAEASLDVDEDYLSSVYQEYRSRRDYLIARLNSIPGVFAPMPMGAFYTMARLPVDDAEKFCLWCLREFRHNGSTLMMAPGAGFYTEAGEGRDEVRIAYVLCKEDLAAAMDVLEAALQAYPGRVID